MLQGRREASPAPVTCTPATLTLVWDPPVARAMVRAMARTKAMGRTTKAMDRTKDMARIKDMARVKDMARIKAMAQAMVTRGVRTDGQTTPTSMSSPAVHCVQPPSKLFTGC